MLISGIIESMNSSFLMVVHTTSDNFSIVSFSTEFTGILSSVEAPEFDKFFSVRGADGLSSRIVLPACCIDGDKVSGLLSNSLRDRKSVV